MARPIMLDLFSGAGGAARGYQDAGFYVVGIDHVDHSRYAGDEFIQADALEYLERHGREFDAIHASPPCQRFSLASNVHKNRGKVYPDYLTPVQEMLQKRGGVWVIENVKQAPIRGYKIELCGLMFGLKVFRHRLFAISHLILSPPSHPSHKGHRIGQGLFSVAGGSGRWKSWGTVKRDVSKGTREDWREAMGMDWGTRKEIAQAIPPAYTHWIGERLMAYIRRRG